MKVEEINMIGEQIKFYRLEKQVKQEELASHYAQKVLELDPNDKPGWVAYLEANNGVCGDEWYDNHFEVIRFFEEFAKKNHQYLLYLGDVAFGKGNREQAREYWEKMIVEYPNTWQAYNCLGEGYEKLGEDALALKMYEKSYEMQATPKIYDGLCGMAQIHERQKDYKNAIKDYERIIQCLKEDHGVKEGEQIEKMNREIARLVKLQG